MSGRFIEWCSSFSSISSSCGFSCSRMLFAWAIFSQDWWFWFLLPGSHSPACSGWSEKFCHRIDQEMHRLFLQPVENHVRNDFFVHELLEKRIAWLTFLSRLGLVCVDKGFQHEQFLSGLESEVEEYGNYVELKLAAHVDDTALALGVFFECGVHDW